MPSVALSHLRPTEPDAPHKVDRGASADATAACSFAIVRTRAAFEALEAEWNDLFERAGRGSQVFQTFNWNWHWCHHYLAAPTTGASSLAVVTGRQGGRLVLVWPLVKEHAAGLTQLTWMGEPVSQYGDVLIEAGCDALALQRAAWRFIATELAPDVVRLRKVRDDAAIAPLLAELGALSTQRLEAPYLDLASAKDFADYEQRYSPRSRRNRRRLARRLEERGLTAMERHREGTRARDLAVLAISLKREWLKDRGLISPALSDPRMAAFFADIAAAETRPVGCEVYALTCDGEAAAIEIGVHCKDRIVMHIIVFNLKYEKAGAGVLLFEDTLAKSFDGSRAVFDLLAPGDGYKLDWADAATGVTDWALPVSAKGWLYARLHLGLARPAMKRAIEALPMSLRRALSERLTSVMARVTTSS
jgi:CelD/BcsL family acetyltransferase involved in cellulose biosynthesis